MCNTISEIYMLLNRRGFQARTRARLRAFAMLAVALALIAASQSCGPVPAATPQAPPTSAALAPTSAAAARAKVQQQPIAGGPVLLRDGIKLRKVVDVQGGSIRIASNP